MVEISDYEIKTIIKSAMQYPYIKHHGEVVPVYGYTKEKRELIPNGCHARYDKLVEKHGTQSPNCVKAIIIGTDAVIKTMFTGEELRGSFGYDGNRKIDELTSQVTLKEREPVETMLDCMLLPKMNNLEELYIDRQILIIAGMNVKMLEELEDKEIVAAIKSDKFASKLFGSEHSILELFPRLATLVLGKREITVNMFKGNWELVKINGSEQSRIANKHWIVEEKTYLKDEQLYRYVREYERKYFGQ